MIAYGCSSLCLLCHVLVVAFEKLDIIFLWILKNISKKLEQLSVSMLDQPQISRNVGKAGKVSDTEIIGIILGEVMQLIMYDCFPVIYD